VLGSRRAGGREPPGDTGAGFVGVHALACPAGHDFETQRHRGHGGSREGAKTRRSWQENECALCLVRGAWFVVLGSWCLVRGAWFVVLGSLCLVRCAWFVVLGSLCLVRCAWFVVRCALFVIESAAARSCSAKRNNFRRSNRSASSNNGRSRSAARCQISKFSNRNTPVSCSLLSAPRSSSRWKHALFNESLPRL
jgi:hypothetical protein